VVVLFLFGFVLFGVESVSACTRNARRCSGSSKQVCSFRWNMWDQVYENYWETTACAAGCSNGNCICTSATVYGSWGACNPGTLKRTRAVIRYVPKGCVGAITTQACCTASSYPDSCSGGVYHSCIGGSVKSGPCTYGSCLGSGCAQCAHNSDCGSGKACSRGKCVVSSATSCGSLTNSKMCEDYGCIWSTANQRCGSSASTPSAGCDSLTTSKACEDYGCIWSTANQRCGSSASYPSCASVGGKLTSFSECSSNGGQAVPAMESNGMSSSYACCVYKTDYLFVCDAINSCVSLGYNSNYTCIDGQCVYKPPVDENGNCTAVNGSCGSDGKCLFGSIGVGKTVVTATGVDFHWSCNGSCGGSNDDSCSYTICSNKTDVEIIDGTCNSNISDFSSGGLCRTGTLNYAESLDKNHDYIDDSPNESQYVWVCKGSANTCNEGGGTDSGVCTSKITQTQWFKVNDGSVLAGDVINYIPKTTCDAKGENCDSTVTNGGVYSKSILSVSVYDKSQKNENEDFNFKTYTYSGLKSQYFDAKGVGTVFADDAIDWSKIKETSGVVFVDGDLDITDNLETNNFIMIIARGKITIEPNVTLINGILVAGEVTAVASTDESVDVDQLIINGMIHGISHVGFPRKLTPIEDNNTSPSVVINYKPELLFKIPVALSKAFSQWKIN